MLVPLFPELVDLRLAHLNLTDTLFAQKTVYPNLRLVDVSYNTLLTDAGIFDLTVACPKLQTLVCDELKTRSTGSVPTFAKCGVTVETLAHLRKNSPHLRYISFSGKLLLEFHSVVLTPP